MRSTQAMREQYRKVRAITEKICAPLVIEDYQTQAVAETSPPKWHLAHVTWFFETFLLRPNVANYRPFHPLFEVLFNSYYETVGKFHPRPKRGLLARPTVAEVYAYRKYVDEAMAELFDQLEKAPNDGLLFFIELGLNHEQQHQELLFMDIKFNFSVNPLKPVYRDDLAPNRAQAAPALDWHEQSAGVYEIGHSAETFAYDNESPRHRIYLNDFRLANRLATNGEYLAFMEDGGYQRVDLWLSDGWRHIQQNDWRHPHYWEKQGDAWYEMTLGGLRLLNLHEPVCHVSYYEAEAFARWAGKRLPTEGEIEVVLAQKPIVGNFMDDDRYHPAIAGSDGQWYGDLWTWTGSAYLPYPGFKPLEGSPGEYNGKFMCNQMVLRGGACITPLDHMRGSYRNFFYPNERWSFCGIRLAEGQ